MSFDRLAILFGDDERNAARLQRRGDVAAHPAVAHEHDLMGEELAVGRLRKLRQSCGTCLSINCVNQLRIDHQWLCAPPSTKLNSRFST